MSKIPTVNELRKQGCKVKVFHRRRKVALANVIAKEFRYDILEAATGILPQYLTASKGGETIVEIIYPDGHTLTGRAVCSRKDMYSKKQGVRNAIGRALSADNQNKLRVGDTVVSVVDREGFESGEPFYLAAIVKPHEWEEPENVEEWMLKENTYVLRTDKVEFQLLAKRSDIQKVQTTSILDEQN